jgi:GNAT superfamily N-acetyltransferase
MSPILIDVKENIEIYHKESFCYSESYSFVLKNYANLVDQNLAFSITPWNNDTCGVFYAKVVESIIGVIVYDTNFNERNDGSLLGITFAFVAPEYRNQGIYTRLHEHVEAWGKENKFPVLATLIHKDNLEFADAVKSKGLVLIMYKTVKHLKK